MSEITIGTTGAIIIGGSGIKNKKNIVKNNILNQDNNYINIINFNLNNNY